MTPIESLPLVRCFFLYHLYGFLFHYVSLGIVSAWTSINHTLYEVYCRTSYKSDIISDKVTTQKMYSVFAVSLMPFITTCYLTVNLYQTLLLAELWPMEF